MVFPIRYGPRYDTALQILMWEFLSRLEELLPVPDLTEVQAQYLNSMKSLDGQACHVISSISHA